MTAYAARFLRAPWSTWVVVELEGTTICADSDLIFRTRAAAQAEASARNEFDEVKREVGTSEENSD